MTRAMRWIWSASTVSTLIALFAVLLAAELGVVALGGDLHDAVASAWAGTWGSGYGAAQVLFRASALAIVGVAADVALRAGLVPIGLESQIGAACLCAAVAGARLPSLGVAGAFAAGALAAMLIALIPAWLLIRRGMNIVMSGLLLIPPVSVAISYALAHGLAAPGTVHTPPLADSLRIEKLDQLWSGASGSSLSHVVWLSALIICSMPLYFRYTAAGRETLLIGGNARACRAEGVQVDKRLLLCLLLSALIASLVSLVLVFGGKGYFEEGMGAGLGFAGLSVALMSRGSAWKLAAYSAGVATLEQAALASHAYLPRDAASVLLAVFLIAVCAAGAQQRIAASRRMS